MEPLQCLVFVVRGTVRALPHGAPPRMQRRGEAGDTRAPRAIEIARSAVAPPGRPRPAMTQCTRHGRSATTRRGGSTTCGRRAGHTQDSGDLGRRGCGGTRQTRGAEELGKHGGADVEGGLCAAFGQVGCAALAAKHDHCTAHALAALGVLDLRIDAPCCGGGHAGRYAGGQRGKDAVRTRLGRNVSEHEKMWGEHTDGIGGIHRHSRRGGRRGRWEGEEQNRLRLPVGVRLHQRARARLGRPRAKGGSPHGFTPRRHTIFVTLPQLRVDSGREQSRTAAS